MKAKRIFKLSLWVVFGLLVVMTFVFLYKKAQPQATIYSVETVTRVPSIQRSIILTGKIAPRNEVMIVPQLNGIIAEIMKKPGDLVKKGDLIGHTDSTGLAFGDHLHFGIIVGGLEVTPIEWLDPKWVRNIVNNINGTVPAR